MVQFIKVNLRGSFCVRLAQKMAGKNPVARHKRRCGKVQVQKRGFSEQAEVRWSISVWQTNSVGAGKKESPKAKKAGQIETHQNQNNKTLES